MKKYISFLLFSVKFTNCCPIYQIRRKQFIEIGTNFDVNITYLYHHKWSKINIVNRWIQTKISPIFLLKK